MPNIKKTLISTGLYRYKPCDHKNRSSHTGRRIYRKRFKELTGMSPVQYINRLKIEKACQMLKGGDQHLQEISDFLGYNNLPCFYKVFKDHTGLTPKEYAKEK